MTRGVDPLLAPTGANQNLSAVSRRQATFSSPITRAWPSSVVLRVKMYKGVIRSRRAERPDFGSGRHTVAAPSREEGQSLSPLLVSLKGHFQSSGRRYSAGVTHDKAYSACQFGRSSFKKASSKPIQTLIEEKVSNEMENRHHSPSLIAKLMGLDTLPPPPPKVAYKHRKNVDGGVRATSSAGCRGNCSHTKEGSCLKCSNEDQEFKDIFEVTEIGKLKKHKNQSTWQAMQGSKESETDMNFIRKKFMDAERLSTDEALQNSKEFDDALEILHSNKDLFLEILQDRSSLLAKHLQEVNHAPVSSHSTQITVLRTSKVDKSRNSERRKSERTCESCSHMHKEVTRSFRKPTSGLINQTPKEHNSGATQNSSTSPYTSKTDSHVHPTHIVVLKPSIGKTQKMIEPISFSNENLNFASRKQRESVASAIQELYKERRDTPMFSGNVGHLGYKAKGYKEIARGIARHMRHTLGSHSKVATTSDPNVYAGKGSSYVLSDISMLNSSQSYAGVPNHFDEQTNDFSPSSSFSTESSVRREARKHMSKRWKMTHRFHDSGISTKGVNTLGEMLAHSDREIPNSNVVTLGKKRVSYDQFAGNDLLGTWDYLGSSHSKTCWDGGNSTKLRRSKSLPAASTAHESPKVCCRKQGNGGNFYMLKDALDVSPDDFLDANYNKRHQSLVSSSGYHTSNFQQFEFVGEENNLPEPDIQVHSEELRKSVHVRILSEDNLLHDALLDEPVANRKHLTDTPLLPVPKNKGNAPTTPEVNNKHFVMQSTLESEDLSGNNENNDYNKEDLYHRPEVDSPVFQPGTCEASHILSSKECEQPSPVSVLEPPSEEESSCSGCFGSISKLRMQLKLLKLESAESHEDEFGISISSDEESAGDSQSVVQIREKLQAFKDEDDRDFSYFLDILIDSGIHGDNQGRYSGSCCSLDRSVDPNVFDKLEEKYGMMESWSRSERKFLFDLVSSIFVGIMPSWIDLQMEDKGLVEGLWQTVVKQRKDLCSLEDSIIDPRWLVVEDDIKIITKDIERILEEHLLDEILSEFVIA
ncbi:hypothetical protein Cni_G17214 [Canna indica]|uniref:DUF4378 domain-containing protein n=1 Tax=Canna indica TaxID=4628 RepID=A0AAQ3QGD2_9LILI|nr:hypothetical protein Cni_G17214 [Canna indica]